MNRRGTVITLLTFFLCSSLMVLAQQKDSKKQKESKQETADKAKSRQQELANKALKKWLEEDVAYIISDEEKAAFKRLTTDEEREQFIEQFWLRRDPTPDTVENEFKEEHYERIAYANERFSSGKPGWKTDRGRIYIIHGKPDEIESHASGGTYDRPFNEGGGTTTTYPFEIWTYRYIEGIGNNVQLEFVDKTLTGEYRLTIDPNLDNATFSNRSRTCSAPRWISAGSLSSASALVLINSVADHGITRKIASGSSSRALIIAWPRAFVSH